MRVSIFESTDGMLGDANGFHTVVLTGTAVCQRGNYSASEIARTIETALAANGYPVHARVDFTDGFGGYINTGISVDLEIAALNEHSAERVRQLLTQQLAGITSTSPVSSFQFLKNVSLRVLSDTALDGGQPNASVNPHGTQAPSSSSGTATGNFVSSFGGAAGVTTPLVAGALLLVLLLKR